MREDELEFIILSDSLILENEEEFFRGDREEVVSGEEVV